jgi:Tol biopolymer transport system component
MKTTGQLPSTLTAFCAAALLCALSALVIPTSAAFAATTERISISTSGEQPNDGCYAPSISGDGRFVAFASKATNLVPGDTNDAVDVFVRDRLTGITERVSVSSTGEQSHDPTTWYSWPSISADGRFVAFASGAADLVPGDTNGKADVFVRDRLNATTERVSVSSAGAQGNDHASQPGISADARFVSFASVATDLVPGDTNGETDSFVRDRTAGTTERVNLNNDGSQRTLGSGAPAISADGRFVAFSEWDDGTMQSQVFVRDRAAGITQRVDVSSTGQPANAISGSPAISADGRFVGIESFSENLAPIPTPCSQYYLRDVVASTTEVVSVSNTGEPMNWMDPGGSMSCSCCDRLTISGDGRFVAFEVAGKVTNLVASDLNNAYDICIRDRANGTTQLVSVSSEGAQGNGGSYAPSISGGGRHVAFSSSATNLVPGDTNGKADIFVRDRGPVAPPGLGIAINDGAACTGSRDVALGLQFPAGSVDMRLRDDPGDWGAWEPCVAEKAWTLSDGDGIKSVCLQCRDTQGTISQEVCDDILLDTTPPTNPSIIINGGAVCTSRSGVTLTLSAAGAYQRRFSNDGQTWSAWQAYGTTASWTLSSGRGQKTVWFQAQDSCGNLSEPATDTIWWALFDDVTCRHPFRPWIEAVAQQAIVSACSTSPPRFCPGDATTRAVMAEALCKAAGKTPLDKATPTFADVPKTHAAYGWIERLADPASWGGTAVTDGCGVQSAQKLFCPDAGVTREQSAKLICRATGKAPMSSCSGVFADVPSARPLCRYVERLADPASWPGGIAVTNGCGGSGATRWFCPASPLTRGQLAVFIVRAFGIPL